jgi:glycerophosphoryl diester phosphodiesterase
MAAFRLANELGADGVELDVHLTSDDRLVVIHDDVLDRTTDGHGPVRMHSWDSLRHLSTGAWFGPQFDSERIPLLEDVLAWAQQTDISLSIELKRPTPALGRAAYPDLAARVIEPVRAFGLTNRVLLFSDDHTAVRDVRDIAPEIATSITLGGALFLDPVAIAREAGASGIAIYWSYASVEVVDRCHAAGLHVFGFGVGDDLTRLTELRAMVDNGTDFLSGGAPDRLRALLQEWTGQAGI